MTINQNPHVRFPLSPTPKAFIINIHADDKKPLFSCCFCVLCQEAVVAAFMRNNHRRLSNTETHAAVFPWKSNSEKFFKCFQHISMKHRPSWNHLDLKQMHWLFSQQALLLGAGTGTRARAVWRGFQPPASAGDSLWHDQYRGERQRKLREDYEDEVSEKELPFRICSFSHLEAHLSQTWMEHHPGTDQKWDVDRG